MSELPEEIRRALAAAGFNVATPEALADSRKRSEILQAVNKDLMTNDEELIFKIISELQADLRMTSTEAFAILGRVYDARKYVFSVVDPLPIRVEIRTLRILTELINARAEALEKASKAIDDNNLGGDDMTATVM